MWQKNHLCDVVVELPQLYEMYCSSENSEYKKMKYFLQENFRESICFTRECWIHWIPPNCSSYTLNESVRLCHCINHSGWAAWSRLIFQGWSIEELKLEKQNTFPMVVTYITDEWQDKCRRMRDECIQVKTNERRVPTSKDKPRSS